jgi:hypothetical protein
MGDNKTKMAIIKATGQKVEVYKLRRGTWCNYNDCKTEYQDSELTFEK